jgi:hypothetical protein
MQPTATKRALDDRMTEKTIQYQPGQEGLYFRDNSESLTKANFQQ